VATYDDSLTALADPTRRTIFERLLTRPLAVGEIAAGLPVTRPAVSQHLATLKRAGLVEDRRAGTRRVYAVSTSGLDRLRATVELYWEQALISYQQAVEDSMADATQATGLIVRKSITVNAPVAQAFEVFTAQIDTWWPRATHSVYGDEVVEVALEPSGGGLVCERTADGREAEWGRIVEWEPPSRVVFDWYPGYGPEVATRLEVRFSAERDGTTRVDLEHRGWEVFGERAAEQHRSYDTGWVAVLRPFVARIG
jgi:DNA-binding transcriptional ArsR family regulator/uncharacterized protein YndB with AHSA1/START domain